MSRSLVAGAIGSAAGEFALNVVSSLDMLVRARPASPMPAAVVERVADGLGVDLAAPGEVDVAANRREAGGALLGYGMAIGTAVVYALLRRAGLRIPLPAAALALGAGAMAISDAAATKLGATEPSTWGLAGWLSDLVMHAAFGLVTAATIDLIDAR